MVEPTHLKNMLVKNWIISLSRGENKKLFQTTTLLFGGVSQSAANPNLLGALLGCLAGSDRNDLESDWFISPIKGT